MLILLQALRWLLLAAEVCIACPVVYLCILSTSAVIKARGKTSLDVHQYTPMSAHHNFAVCIPAHDEEILLPTLLESLASLEYPKELYTIYVVADNCTDRTAQLARQYKGVRVYERFDAAKRGKGYALSWLWQRLEEQQLIHDAYVVLDADSVVVPVFLQAMDIELVRGARALQACHTVLNVSASPSTALRWLALSLHNHLRPLGRNGIGSSSTLTGNGMCLSRELLRCHPWQAFSIVEDYQYYLTLVQNGEWVRYVPEAIVYSHMPTTFAQMRTQDVRWEAAELRQSHWRIAQQLLSSAVRLKSFICIEAAVELLTPPLSFLVSACLTTFVASLLLLSPTEMLLSVALLGGVTTHIATAFYLLRPDWMVYKALLYAPGFMFWKLWVYFVLSRKHTGEWVRTSRTPS